MENKEYNKVPSIITGKDLDYLSDMFEWNYGALKKTSAGIHGVEDEEIKDMLEKGFNLFKNEKNQIHIQLFVKNLRLKKKHI